MPRWFVVIMLAVCIWWGYAHFHTLSVNPVITASQNIAENASTSAPSSQDVTYQVRVLQTYQGEFRVLSSQNYFTGREAQFSPLDIAVGWADMARPEIYSQVEIKQRNRWYYWQTEHLPIALAQISQQSANMHLVPANDRIAKQFKHIHQHDLLYLKGALIEIRANDGWRWRSSLSRNDTGSGACEVMRVDEIRWL